MEIPPKTRKLLVDLMSGIIIVFSLLFCVVPIYWAISSSFKFYLDITRRPPVWFPWPIDLEWYRSLFLDYNFHHYVLNSVIVTVGATILCVGLSIGAAYSFSRFRIKGAKHILFFILSTKFISPVIIAVPLYLLYTQTGLFDTYQGLILAFAAINLPLGIWVLRSFFLEIPPEAEEAAQLDGCSKVESFLRMGLPMALPGVLAVTLLTFIFSWNEYVLALLLSSYEVMPGTVWAAFLARAYQMTNYGQAMAGATIMFIPSFIVAIAVRQYLARGLTFGLIK